MEKKLAEYRAKKEREAKISKVKGSLNNFLDKFVLSSNKQKPVHDDTTKEPFLPQEEEIKIIEPVDNVNDDDDDDLKCCTYTDIIYYVLWFSLWVILYIIFIELQFGTVFLIVSALIFMYINTRTGPKKSDEISAYSVFNKNCESIKGTLKAEQFERELIYGPGVIR